MLVKETFCFSAYDTQFLPSYFPGMKLIISLEGSFSGVVNGEPVSNVTSLIINRNVTHSLEVAATGVLIYYVDYHSALEPALRAQLKGRAWCAGEPPAHPIIGRVPQDANRLLESLFPTPTRAQQPTGSWQIDPLLRYVDAHIREPITLADVAPLLSLSIERTRHLFIEQVGMPFSQYLIWMRLKLVINATLTQPQPLGELAVQYGFADPSHFQRLFKRTFGSTPNQLLRRSGRGLLLGR